MQENTENPNVTSADGETGETRKPANTLAVNSIQKSVTIEELLNTADNIEDAMNKYWLFLKRCETELNNLTLLRGRYSSWQNSSAAGSVLNTEMRVERNSIRAALQKQLLSFRQEALKEAFPFQGRDEFLANITSRDDIIHELLDLHLGPKRYYRDDQNVLRNPKEKPGENSPEQTDRSKIAEGNSSIVYRLFNMDTKRHAIAIVIKAAVIDDAVKEDIHKLTDLRHRNVIKLLDHSIHHFPYFVIIEYVYGETLHNALALAGPRPVPQAADWLYQLADALDYLRHKRILHTNVRPSKIHVDAEWQIVISPFDLVRYVPASKPDTDLKNHMPTDLTLNRYRELCQYGSPELLRSEGAGLELAELCVSDLFSIGLIGYKILTGKELFEGKHVIDILENRRRFLEDKRFRAEKLKALPPGRLSAVLRKLLIEDPEKRRAVYNGLHALLRDLHPLTRTDLNEGSHVQRSYRRCLSNNKEFIRDFYGNFYKKELERGVDRQKEFSLIGQKRQSAMLQMAVDVLLDLDNRKEYLSRLVGSQHSKHGKYSVADFDVFLRTFIDTVRENDRPFWSDELEAAWQGIYEQAMAVVRASRNG